MRPSTRARALVLAAVATASLAPSAQAANPSKAECLAASEAWIKAHKANHLRDARAQLLVCAAPSCPADVREECARHVPDVARQIPSVVFAAKDGAGADLGAVTVTMDGQPFAARLDGTAIELDPGEHTFHFVAPGLPPLDRTLVILQGEPGRREALVLGAPPAPPIAATAQTAVVPQGPVDTPSATSGGGGLGGGRIAALALAGVGVAGIVVGGVFAASASSKWSQAKADCGAGCGPDAPAQGEKTDAQNAATLSTVAFVAGGAMLAAGAVLWFVFPGSGASSGTGLVRVAPQIGAGTGGAVLTGSF
jgi:hypothetical protein